MNTNNEYHGGVLGRDDILREIENGTIIIDPFNIEYLNVDSYDICLGNLIEIPDFASTPTQFFEEPFCQSYHIIDYDKGIIPERKRKVLEDGEAYPLMPEARILASSLEKFGSLTCKIELDGRSGRARSEFVQVHSTAKTVHCGHILHITFEIFNHTPNVIILRPGTKIAQIEFYPLTSIPEKLYDEVGNFGQGSENFTNQLNHIKRSSF